MNIHDVVITVATRDDVDILFRWGEDNWELWGDDKYKWFSKKSLNRWILDHRDDILLVARQGNRPVGMCMISVMRDWSFCFGLYVEEEFRGMGLGKRILQEGAKRLKKQGVESIMLLVDTKNTKALKFYEQEGFYKGFQFHIMTKVLL